HPNALKALLIDRNDHGRTGWRNWSGKPESKIVSSGIQFSEISGPGQQKDRNGHEKAGGYRSQNTMHLFKCRPTGHATGGSAFGLIEWRLAGPPTQAAYYTLRTGNIIALATLVMAKVRLTLDHIKTGKYVLNVESVGLSPEQFFRLCRDNPELRLELTAQKEIIVMSPTNSKTGVRNAEINRQLGNWAVADGRGVVFDSNTGFTLPNGA